MMRKWKRPAAFLLAAAMIFTMPGVPASAVEAGVSAVHTGLCEHHPEHTEDCEYTEGTEDDSVAEVTIGSTTTQYADIVAAFTAAQGAESAAVKLLTNVTLSKERDYGIELERGNITLDLNGCTIQTTGVASDFFPRNAVFFINDGSSLTVQDNGNDGKIVQPNGGQAIGVINGNLTVKSGIIEVTSDSAAADSATTQNCAVFVSRSGVADIQGGTLIGNRGIYIGGKLGGGTLTVGGGTIHGRGSYALQVAGGSTALSGGSYTTDVTGGCSIWNADGTAAALLDSAYRYQDESGKESAYSENKNGVVGNTTVAVRPANEFAYMGADGTEQTHAGCTELTEAGFEGAQAGTTTWFAANTDITADDPLQVCGTVNLILCDGVAVTLNKGISLSGDAENVATLNIYAQSRGTGKLICGGASNSTNAGIYINAGTTCTTALNIYGGNITATGSSDSGAPDAPDNCGAGIGTSANDMYGSTMTVNISGGTVTAKSGGEGAAVIGNGTKAKGTVTVKIAPGMKCVKTDDQNTAYDPGNTDGTSVTVTKCNEHEWEYKVEVDKHTKTCKLCGFDGVSETHKAEKYVSVSETQHDIYCVCGKKLSTEEHAVQYTPNADGLTHKTSCNHCGWTSADEKHTFGENGACVCGVGKAAEYNGQQYASLQAAVNAAAKAADGGTVTLARDVQENVTVAGGTLTVDLNGKTWRANISEDPDIWGRIPLTVTGGSVTLENGTLDQGWSTSLCSYGIRIQGGSVTVKGDAVVIGSNTTGSAANISYPAIILESGNLTLETGATLVYGLEVPEGKHLSDYLPEGTAFKRYSYDASTKTWTTDNGYVPDVYTTNVYHVPNTALVVAAHPEHTFTQENGVYVCACGYVCPHNEFVNGVCTVCGNECAHKITESTDAAGNVTAECTVCGAQMAVKSETGGTVTYGTDFKAAMKAAVDGTKITLLADVLIPRRTGISGDDTTVTLDLNGHKITSGWLDVGGSDTYTACTLKIIGKGSYEPPMYGGIITVNVKATLDLSDWEGGTISEIDISDDSRYEAATREAAVIVGPKAGTIGNLRFGNNQLPKITKTKLSGGSFTKIEAANHQPVKLGDLLVSGYALQHDDGSYEQYTKTLQNGSIYNVKVVKCLHPNMEPDAATGIATCEYCGKSGKFVASVDGNLYTDMKKAIDYWLANGGTLKLYGDYTAVDGTWSIGSGTWGSGSHTINLNGHRMSVQGDGAFQPTNKMRLTVTDGKEIGRIENILLDGSQGWSFTLESGHVGNLEMTHSAVVALKGGSVDKLDVKNSSAYTKLSIQGGSLGELNIKDWADGMRVSATGGSLGAYTLPSGKILADVLDHQYYATGTSLDRQVDAAQLGEKFIIQKAPYDFGSTSKAAEVPINGRIPFMVDSPSGDAGVYDVKWYRRTNSGAEHMTENRVAGVNVNDTLDVFCVITGLDRPGGAMQWQVAVKGYTINVVPVKLNGDQTVITQKPNTGNTGNPENNRLVVTPFFPNALNDVEYQFEVTYNGQPLELGKDYTIKDSSNRAKNAGTHMLTIEGTGNYTGEKSVTWTLEPYELSVENFCYAKIEKMYDGTDAVTDSTNGINGLNTFSLDSNNPRNPILSAVDNFNLDKSDYQLSNMKFDSAEAGDRTFTGTMTLTSGGNFVFADGSREMQIEYSSGSGRQFVFINRAIIVAPAAKALQVANNHAATYTVDLSALLPALEAPREYGAVTYGAPTVNLSNGYYTDGAKVENGKLTLPIQKNDVETTGSVGTVTVVIKSINYEDITLTVKVSAVNQITPVPDGTITATPITYGNKLSASTITGTMKNPNTGYAVNGTFAWTDGTIKPGANDHYEAEWTFTPDAPEYATVTGKATVEVAHKSIEGATLTLKRNSLEYNAAEQSPKITGVTLEGWPETITYRIVSGDKATDANDSITLTIEGTGNYTGTATAEWKINPAELTVSAPSEVKKAYDGTTNATVTPTFNGLQGGENLTAADYSVTAAFDNANVGYQKTVTGKVTLNQTDTAKNYVLKDGGNFSTDNGTIAKAVPPTVQPVEMTIYNDVQKDYFVDLPPLPDLGEGKSYGTVNYNNPRTISLSEGYTAQSALGADPENLNTRRLMLRMNQTGSLTGEIGTVTIPVATSNYEDITLTVNVNAVNQIKPVPDGTITATPITYGNELSASTITGKMKDSTTREEVNGMFTWLTPAEKLNTGSHNATWIFTPDNSNGGKYTTNTGIATVTVNPKAVTVSGITANDKVYDGKTNATLDCSNAKLDGVLENDTLTVTVTGTFESANAGEQKVKISGFKLGGDSAANYVLAESGNQTETTATITKAAAPDFTKATVLTIVNGHEKTYTVTIPALPTLETPKEYGALTYEIGGIKLDGNYYTSGAKVEDGKLILPIQKNDVETTGSVGTVTVVIKSINYEDITLTVNVNATNKLVPTVTAPTANALTYNGAEQALVTAGKTTGGTMLYRLGDSEWSEQIPTAKNAGKYTVWYKVQGNAEYADMAEQSLTVTIAKKAVTVTALDKSAYTGSTAPDLSSPEADKDYKMEGLVGADTLSGTVILTYEQTPDMSKTGKTAINITGTLSNDNYEITYIPGTLTVTDGDEPAPKPTPEPTPNPTPVDQNVQKAQENVKRLLAQADELLRAGQGSYDDASWRAFTAAYEAAKKGGNDVASLQKLADALTAAQSNLTLKNGTAVTDATGVFTYKVTGADTVEVTGITEKGKKKAAVKISSTMKGNGKTYKITSVAANALKGNKKMTSLTIGNNVVTIGKNAFANCTKLKKVTVNGNKLKTIGKNAFSGDKKLKTINMKKVKSLKTVGKSAFKGISKKVTVKVPGAKKAAYKRLFKKGGIAASRIK